MGRWLIGLAMAAAVPGLDAQERVQRPTVVIRGTVVDSISDEPIRLAVVRVAETGASLLTNDGGGFRLEVPMGLWTLDARRVGYRPVSVPVTASPDSVLLTIRLAPVPLELEELTVAADDDLAAEIIRRAIARKQDVLAGLEDYAHPAFVRFLLRNLTKPQDSAESIIAITESRIDVRWARPDRYQERIVSRRQSGNVAAENNLVTVGELLNFSRNRIEIGPHLLPSPIADDALRHYRYRILDTLRTEAGPAFRLAIEPRSELAPAFAGVIDILDATYHVLGIDVGLNEGARVSPLVNVRYRQVLADQGGGRWMPREIRFSAELDFKVPFPGLPRRLGFEHVALMGDFAFDRGGKQPDFHYRVIVDDDADRPDSTRWAGAPRPPLAPVEERAWARIDSIAERRRGGIRAVFRLVATAMLDSRGADFFHFNRVDGVYAGAGVLRTVDPRLRVAGKLGYGFGDERVQYELGSDVRVLGARDFWLGWRYHDQTMARPTTPSGGRDGSMHALLARDPFDYYRERGLVLSAESRLVGPLRIGASYRDARQTSLPLSTDFSVRRGDHEIRDNAPITEGRLRALTGSLTLDTRPAVRTRGMDLVLPASEWSWLRVAVEVSDPALIPSDFSYRRVQVEALHRRRLGGLGAFTIRGIAGWGGGALPPQRHFAVDHGTQPFVLERVGFNTMRDTVFAGNRMWAVTATHEFGRRPFAASGIPLIRELPIRLSVQGGAFRTSWHGVASPLPAGAYPATDRTYGEVGIRLDGLTPFLSPFDLSVSISRQLSSETTKRWAIGFGFLR